MTSASLNKLTDMEVAKLKQLYELKSTTAPHMCGLLYTYFKWKRIKPHKNYLTFFALGDDWKTSGTFAVRFSVFDIIVFTLEESGTNLYSLLTETSILKVDHRLAFYNPIDEHLPTIYRALRTLNMPIKLTVPCNFYWIPKERALEFKIECPDDVYLGDVNKSHVPLILSFWPHKFEGSEMYLSIFIEMNGAYGLFLKKDDTLVCWILRNHWGMLTVLETVPEYKRRGFASFIITAMSKVIAEEGNNPLCTIIIGNMASEILFKKLGFQRLTGGNYVLT